jgi:hypothetical protein
MVFKFFSNRVKEYQRRSEIFNLCIFQPKQKYIGRPWQKIKLSNQNKKSSWKTVANKAKITCGAKIKKIISGKRSKKSPCKTTAKIILTESKQNCHERPNQINQHILNFH